jgi:pimeloyl-ACP methyl ester carboxylesterase
MQFVKKDGVNLAYKERNPGARPILFVHGWGCDHTFFAPQEQFFSRSHHVISVDLRGHGKSDTPEQEYTMAGLADDLAWLCTELDLVKPAVVGHSMGGNVALELASRHPDIPSSVVMVDSVVFPSQEFRNTLEPVVEALQGPDYVFVCQYAMRSICLSTDEEPLKTEIVSSLPKAPRHVLVSALNNHLIEYDSTSAAVGCRVPIAYIGAAVSTVDLSKFHSLTPQLVSAQTLGSGHFCQLFVPDQINAMISRFLSLYSSA